MQRACNVATRTERSALVNNDCKNRKQGNKETRTQGHKDTRTMVVTANQPDGGGK